jgi:hypothetical protein
VVLYQLSYVRIVGLIPRRLDISSRSNE